MTWHKLKTWPDAFAAVRSGMKTHEYRKNDRGFEIGDMLELREFNPVTGQETNDFITRKVTYVSRGPAWGIPDGYCVMSIVVPSEAGRGF